MKLYAPKPFWFTQEGISKIESLKNARYMGYWCTKSPSGLWNETPVDVFYVTDPDVSKGHSHYFGMFYRDKTLFITNAASAFEDPLWGKLTGDEVVVSRYRHDYVQHGDVLVDGGRDYFRASPNGQLVKVTVRGGDFLFSVQRDIKQNDAA